MNEEIKLILESNQLIIRDRLANDLFNSDEFERKARGIDTRITQILNPRHKPTLNEETAEHFALQEDSA